VVFSLRLGLPELEDRLVSLNWANDKGSRAENHVTNTSMMPFTTPFVETLL
jgi:hypothetical protein